MKTTYLLALVLLCACAGDPCTGEGALKELARNNVSEQLKAPSTAKFLESTVEPAPNGGMLVKGSVDAQNAMGVPIREEYAMNIRCDAGQPFIYYATMGGNSWGFLEDSINKARMGEEVRMLNEAAAEAEQAAADAARSVLGSDASDEEVKAYLDSLRGTIDMP